MQFCSSSAMIPDKDVALIQSGIPSHNLERFKQICSESHWNWSLGQPVYRDKRKETMAVGSSTLAYV